MSFGSLGGCFRANIGSGRSSTVVGNTGCIVGIILSDTTVCAAHANAKGTNSTKDKGPSKAQGNHETSLHAFVASTGSVSIQTPDATCPKPGKESTKDKNVDGHDGIIAQEVSRTAKGSGRPAGRRILNIEGLRHGYLFGHVDGRRNVERTQDRVHKHPLRTATLEIANFLDSQVNAGDIEDYRSSNVDAQGGGTHGGHVGANVSQSVAATGAAFAAKLARGAASSTADFGGSIANIATGRTQHGSHGEESSTREEGWGRARRSLCGGFLSLRKGRS